MVKNPITITAMMVSTSHTQALRGVFGHNGRHAQPNPRSVSSQAALIPATPPITITLVFASDILLSVKKNE